MTFEDDKIIVQEKKQHIIYYVHEKLEEAIPHLQTNKEVIITLNTTHNFEALLKEWKTLCQHKELTIIFTNPQENQTWIIQPHIHQKISEKEKLKEGLKALFANVPRV